MEIWKDIAGYEGDYQVSNLGRVKSLYKGERILKPKRHTGGYLQTALYRNSKADYRFIHRLVAEAFISNPENKPTVNHLDGDKTNNRTDNLEWSTQHENNQHAVTTGLVKSGGSDRRASVTNEIAQAIRTEFAPYDDECGLTALAKKYGLSLSVVFRIVHGERYKTTGGQRHEKKPHLPHKHLSSEIRNEIRRTHKPRHPKFGTIALAKKYGVHPSTIRNIVKGR